MQIWDPLPHYRQFISTSCGLVFACGEGVFDRIGNTHIVPYTISIIFTLYLNNFIHLFIYFLLLYRLLLVIIQICQLTARDKLVDALGVEFQ